MHRESRAKQFGHLLCDRLPVNYREAYGMFAANGILFNHESPNRDETFVTRKVTRGVVRIEVGLDEVLYLGNLEAKRDWATLGTMSRVCTRSFRPTKPTTSCSPPERCAPCARWSSWPLLKSATRLNGEAKAWRRPASTPQVARTCEDRSDVFPPQGG